MLFLIAALMVAGQPGEAESGGWAWLNIPDVEGPAARFSYDTAVRRDGGRVHARIRYSVSDAADPVEALVEIDCLAGTQRTLAEARGPRVERHPDAPAAPIAPATRESVLAYLLCPGGGRP